MISKSKQFKSLAMSQLYQSKWVGQLFNPGYKLDHKMKSSFNYFENEISNRVAK